MKRHWAAEPAPGLPSGNDTSVTGDLRRSDWRFLIGTTTRPRALTRAGSSLTESVRAVAATVESVGTASGPAPLVVLSKPRPRELARAAHLLEAGGCCYVEREWPGIAGIFRARRQFRRAGFTDIQCYWMWPPHRKGSPLFWLPLPGRGARAYFLGSRTRGSSPRRRALLQLRELVWRLGAGLGSLGPLCVIGWKGQAAPNLPLPLTEELRRRWPDWGLGPPPSKVDCLMLTGGESDRNKVTILAFAEPFRLPAIVVKCARSSVSEPGLEHEGRTLLSVEESRMASVVDIPKVAFSGRMSGAMVVAETAIEGQPISTALSKEAFPEIAREVAITLGAAVEPEGRVPAEQSFQRLVAPVVEGFRQRFGTLVDHIALDREVRALRTLPDLPPVVEHRDCSPWNVLRTSSGRLAMLDWESAEPQGLPVLDLAYFLVNAVFLLEEVLGSGHEGESYTGTLVDSGLGAVISAAAAEYCSVSGVPREAWRPLRTFCWMLHACVEHDRILTDGAIDGSPAAGPPPQSMYLSLWMIDTGSAPVDH